MQRSLLGSSLTNFSRWRRRRTVRNTGTLSLVILGPILTVATFAALGPLGQAGTSLSLRAILMADLIYILVVAALVANRVVQMIAARRARSAGSRLHLRLTGVFTLLALIPTVLVAVFAMITVNFGLEGWFSDRVRLVLGTSLAAAQAYEEEHRQQLARDGNELAAYLDTIRQATFFMSSGEVRQALGRIPERVQQDLYEIYVIDGGGNIEARGPRSYEFGYEQPQPSDFAEADATGLYIIEDWDNNEFRALIPLTAFVDRYLYVSREVDGEILALLDDTQETVSLYQQLENERGRLLFEFGLLYLGFAVILILAAVWLGLWFAERLARPVGRLASAAQRVGKGDLTVRVREEDGDDEIAMLSRDFNRMTKQLRAQRNELLDNTKQIERRRRLFDSVLSSVSSGVVGLDAKGQITFVNPSARRLLDMAGDEGTSLVVAIPEFAPLFEEMTGGHKRARASQEQVSLMRGGQQETLLVRMSPRRGQGGGLEGYVVAFDDVTDLVSAQRMAAWGDVARRIAHEIKNPLTPIQLSAERIKRKFSPEVDDPERLEQMTDVIVRQTNDLRRIVDEFSRFARMPEPDRMRHDLAALVRDAVTLQDVGQPRVRITWEIPPDAVIAEIDATMINQALTNLLKNAGEATETRREKGLAPEGYTAAVHLTMTVQGTTATITIDDNGAGLPDDRSRLFEPYVTTRDKGTGLGLPIVKKIIEEHGGALSLTDADPMNGDTHNGARATIQLPVTGEQEQRE